MIHSLSGIDPRVSLTVLDFTSHSRTYTYHS